MSPNNIYFLLFSTFISVIVSANSQAVHKRFEYKYSFKPPYLAQKDGTVPFWEYGGNAIASGDSVRLAPSLRSQKGAIWSKNAINFEWWEVDIMFKVTGRGRIGADGLAFWYTTERGEYTGDVFGSSDKWNGLAVIFDSFDNDNKHNNPYIMAVVNDGTKNFDHKNDGSTQLAAGCLRDFRNKPFPTRARVEYYLNTLTVYFHNGMSSNPAEYELCFRAENIVLPRGGKLGLSAATGGLADDHDVLHVLTSSLHTQQAPDGQQMSSAEQQKLSAEYQEYQRRLDAQKEEYRREHPDEVRDKDGEPDDWFESDGQRELRQIFHGQAAIHDTLKELHKKLDEVVGKQMNALSLLTSVHSMQQGQPPPPHGQLPQVPAVGAVGRHEWEVLAANSQVLINTVAELKGFVIEVNRKADTLLTSGGGGGAGAAAAAGAELREAVNLLRQTAGNRLPAAAASVNCPSVSCVGLGGLLAVVAAQLVVMFLYSAYKERKEAQAKKFF